MTSSRVSRGRCVQRELAGWRVTRHVPRSWRTPSSHVDVNVPSITRFCASPRNVADAWQLRSGSQYDAIVPLISPRSARTKRMVSNCVYGALVGPCLGSFGGYGRYGACVPSATISTSPDACSSPADKVKSITPCRPEGDIVYEPLQCPLRISQSARLANTGTGGGFPAHATMPRAIGRPAATRARQRPMSGQVERPEAFDMDDAREKASMCALNRQSDASAPPVARRQL